MMKSFGIAFALICISNLSESAKILTIFPIPFKEHQSVYRPLIESLHNNGHHITLMTTNPSREASFENVTEIDLSFVYSTNILNELRDGDLEGSEMLKTVFNVMRKLFEAELKSPQVQSLLNNHKEYFDLVLVEWSGSSSLMNIFAHQFKAPLVAITNGEAFPNVHEAFGNPNHPVSYPSVFLPFSEDLNLLQRISSVLFTLWYRFYYYTEEIPLQNEIIRNVLNDENAPDMLEIETNADLLFINSYELLQNIRPSVPTTVYLGGIHQTRAKRDLSQSLKQFLDDSERAVYVNLNNGIHQYQPRLQKLLSILVESDFDIIWNLNDGDDFLNTTLRIYQQSELDQESILAHSKVVLHITDGGQRNIEDSIHYAVPVFGISYTSTLDHYLYQMEKFDSGIISYIDFDNQQELSDKFRAITCDNRFKTNMNKVRNMILDQPIRNSVERAIWWIEYVIRNGGTKHLRNKKINWVKYLMVDVILAVSFGFVSMLLILAYIFLKIRSYSKSLPFERVTRGSKSKVL